MRLLVHQISELGIIRSIGIVIVIVILVAAASGAFYFFGYHGGASISSSTSSTTGNGTSVSTSSSSGNQTSILPYDSSTHTVSFELVAENLPNNGITTQVDYNATNLGAMEIFVPAGSNLNITFQNQESLPHNLVLIKNNTAVPTNKNVTAQGTLLLAIGTTSSTYAIDGIKGGTSANGSYDNIPAGTYWLTCGINKHAAEGLWTVIVASSTITSPYVMIKNPPLSPAGFS